MALAMSSSSNGHSDYDLPDNIWKVLDRQFAFLSGAPGSADDVVCVPEGVAPASKLGAFLVDFEATLKFLSFCISQRECSFVQERRTFVLVNVSTKNVTADKLGQMLQIIERVFPGDARIFCKSKQLPTESTSITFIEKKASFLKEVGDASHLHKDFGGKWSYNSSQHKQWAKSRKDLHNLTDQVGQSHWSMTASTGAMERDFSQATLGKSKEMYKVHVSEKSKFFDSNSKIQESLFTLKKSLKTGKNVSLFVDWPAMLKVCTNLTREMKESMSDFEQYWEDHKSWLEWRMECYFFLTEITKVTTHVNIVVDSFKVSNEQLEDKAQLLQSLKNVCQMLERVRNFVTVEQEQSGDQPCMKQMLQCLQHWKPPKFLQHSKNWVKETQEFLLKQWDVFLEACLVATSRAEAKLDLLAKAGSIHKYFAEHREWCLSSDRALAEAIGYSGRDKQEKQKILDSLVRHVERQPCLRADTLAKFDRLLELFTPRVQEVKLSEGKVMDRLQKQLKSWGYSLEAADGTGLEGVYQEMLESEEKYVRELELVVEYLKAVEEGPAGLTIPVIMKRDPQAYFGNVQEIWQFHDTELLPSLRKCGCNPKKISQVFSDTMGTLEVLYSQYCKNYDQNKSVIEGSQAQSEFQAEMQIRLKHIESLPQLLVISCTRINIYKQLLISMVKYAPNQPCRNELQGPISLLTKVLQVIDRRVSEKYGKALLDKVMKVRLPHRIRATFKDRHVILFESALSICKTKEQVAARGNKKMAAGRPQEKCVIKFSELHLPTVVQGNPHQFTVTKDKRDVILIDAGSPADCKLWVEQLQAFLSNQLQQAKSETVAKSGLMDIQNAQVITAVSPTTSLPSDFQGASVRAVSPTASLPSNIFSKTKSSSKWPWSKTKSLSASEALGLTPGKDRPSPDGMVMNSGRESYVESTGHDSFDDSSDEGECDIQEEPATLHRVLREYSQKKGENPISINQGEIVEVTTTKDGYHWLQRLAGGQERGWVPVECLQLLQ